MTRVFVVTEETGNEVGPDIINCIVVSEALAQQRVREILRDTLKNELVGMDGDLTEFAEKFEIEKPEAVLEIAWEEVEKIRDMFFENGPWIGYGSWEVEAE